MGPVHWQKKLNVNEGDSVTMFDTENRKEHTFTIEKLADTYAGEFLFMPLDQFNEAFGHPADANIGIWSEESMSFSNGEIQSTKSIDAIVSGIGMMINQMGPMVYTNGKH